jgi:hypothetical protein
MGVLTLFSLLFGEGDTYWLAHHQFVLENWALPYRSISFDRKWQNRNTFALPYGLSFQFTYISVEFGQTICDRTEVLLGLSCGGQLKNLGEPHENTLGTRGKNKIHPPFSFLKGKNWTPSWVHAQKLWDRECLNRTPKGHMSNGRRKMGSYQELGYKARNNANMMSHMQICTTCNNFKKASKKKMTLTRQPYSLTEVVSI